MPRTKQSVPKKLAKPTKRKSAAKVKAPKVWQGPVPGDPDYGVCYSEWEMAHAKTADEWGAAAKRPARWQMKELDAWGYDSAIGRPAPAPAPAPAPPPIPEPVRPPVRATSAPTRTTFGLWLQRLLGIS